MYRCCAVDFSDASRFAMAEAADLARRFQAQLTLVHVYEPPSPLGADLFAPTEDLFVKLSIDLERTMAAWRSEAGRRAGAAVRSSVLVGDPVTGILGFARGQQIDLLVVGTHGRTALEHLVQRSVAERVVRQAPCPVLVVRQKELHGETVTASNTATEKV